MTARLEVERLEKAFGATRALAGVSLAVAPGEVHAVLGENGAGKSTLMAALGGALRPDGGAMRIDGEAFAPRSPREARDRGVSVVHQELSICPHLTVAENVMLGREPASFGVVRRRDERAAVERALADVLGDGPRRFGPSDRAGALSMADQQLVEIARALATAGTRVLVLDEPTSSLARADVERLFALVRALAGRGIAVLYVSHFLDEVREICGRYTVLRDGADVRSGAVADCDNADLVAAMSGARAEVHERARRPPPTEVLVRVESLAGARLPKDASFELRRGEIVGIAGLVGSGRTELLRAVFGLDPVRSGRVQVSVSMGLLSEDRKGEGLALGLPVYQNVTLARLGRVVRPSREVREAAALVERLAIKATPTQTTSALSGGNQQKVALARLLHQRADVLLLDEPTRGVDVASKAEILGLLDELAASGKAIVVVSSQLEELVSTCDRVHVMKRGVLGAARPVAEVTARALLEEASSA